MDKKPSLLELFNITSDPADATSLQNIFTEWLPIAVELEGIDTGFAMRAAVKTLTMLIRVGKKALL